MTDTPKKEIDTASQHYQDIVNNGLNHMSEAADEINAFVAERKRVVPEVFFINNLLPTVRGHVRNEPVELGYWLNVAGGLNNPIEVVDENQKFLFTVPPPFTKLPDREIAPTGNRFTTIAHLVGAQADMQDNGDTRGSMVIDNELTALCAPRPEDEEKTKNLLLLVEIYDRYELPMVELLGGAADEIVELLKARKGKTGNAQQSNKTVELPEDDDLLY